MSTLTMAAIKFKIFIFLIFAFVLSTNAQEESCMDIEGREVEHGLLFVAGPNVCRQCVCHNSEPKWCQTMFCNGPPYGCKNYTVGKTCCQFECLDPPTTVSPLNLIANVRRSPAVNICPSLLIQVVLLFVLLI